jgi:hemolysin III
MPPLPDPALADESLGERIANAVTHGAGAVLAVGAGAVLVTLATLRATPWHVVGAAVFTASLVLLYGASALYHAIPHPTARRRLRVLDHAAIYVLIAGTYTPFLLTDLRGPLGWSLLAAVWGMAAAGVVFKLVATGRWRALSTALYLAMGWLVVVAWVPLTASVTAATLAWLVAGGVSYTAGVAFFLSRRRYAHAVWHGFVLAGSACHVAAAFASIVAA